MKDDIRVILADNNVQDRESKKRLLNEQGIQVVYETGDGKKALENIKKLKPDVVVMDMIDPNVKDTRSVNPAERVMRQEMAV